MRSVWQSVSLSVTLPGLAKPLRLDKSWLMTISKAANNDQTSVDRLIGEQIYWFIGIALLFLIRNIIESIIAGLMVFFGNDYNSDDVVYVDGLPGRIIRVGIYKTVFFLYDISNDAYTGKAQVTGGTKLVVQNSSLKDMKIEKPLQNLDLIRYMKESQKKERRDNGNRS